MNQVGRGRVTDIYKLKDLMGREFLADTGPVADDLMKFILTRHANWRMGGNLKPAYLEGAA